MRPAVSPPPAPPLDPSPEELRRWIQRCGEFVIRELSSLASQPARDTEGVEALEAAFRGPVPEGGSDLGSILERLRPAVGKGFNTAGPGYMAYIPGGGIPSAALADFIALAINRYVGVAAAAPVLTRIEQTAVEWLAAMMGYPATAGGILTSGGSLSNLTAIVTARVEKLPEQFLSGTLYVSGETHHSVAKAARLAGFPAGSIRTVPADRRLRMIPAELEAAVRRDREDGRRPFLVVASAGTTNTGAIDPLPEILEVARRHDLWAHADAAYGGFFRLVPGGERLFPGIESCDSITIDPHKGLFLPYGTGCLLARDPGALRRAHRGEAAGYLQELAGSGGRVNYNEISPELSRDFRGLRVWLPLVLHGLSAFRRELAGKLELARRAWEELRDEPSLEMLDEPQLSVVAFSWAGRGDRDAMGRELLRRVNGRRRVFLSSSRIAGRYALRICVLSFRTHREEVDAAVRIIREEARALGAG